MPYLVHRFIWLKQRSWRAIRLHHVAVFIPFRKSNSNLTEEINPSYETCHPNPTALVGNLLTGRGNVVEVVKVR